MRKKRRVPEVLWRLYRNGARTLADTIVSLLPPPPPSAVECRCKGRRCLGCSGENAMSFLLRLEDPPEYRKLLIRCFLVVSENAPPIKLFYPDHHWSQLQIVRRTIEMIMHEEEAPSNVLCNGYNKLDCSSPILGLLTSPPWDLLLKRVGDDVMVYILKFASIFLPLPHGKHYQVAGPPISGQCLNFSKHASGAKCWQPTPMQLGFRRKRKRDAIENKAMLNSKISAQQCSNILDIQSLLGSGGPVTSFGKGVKSSNEATIELRKHCRPFSWQRRRKCARLNLREDSTQTPYRTSFDGKGNFPVKLQQVSVTSLSQPEILLSSKDVEQNTFEVQSEMIKSECLCCLILRSSQRISRARIQIKRQNMLYNSRCSSSVFPKNHILNNLKANLPCASFLARDIFGLSVVNPVTQSRCFHRSPCLYHSLLKSLKSLIRKAHNCQNSKLLHKHCAIPSSDQSSNANVRSMFKGTLSEGRLFHKGDYEVQLEHDFSVQNSDRLDNGTFKETMQTFDHQFELNKHYCNNHQVVSFIWAVCRSIIPPDLLGTAPIWRVLRRNISKFIRLRRFEKFSLKQCMHGMKASSFRLLSNSHSSFCLTDHVGGGMQGNGICSLKRCSNATVMLKHRLFENWILWFFSYLVVPIIQANFYSTESEFGRDDIFYYRKPIWGKITKTAITYLKDQSYCLLDDASFRNIVSKRQFGFSKVRLRPKENGVRVLANLTAASKVPVHQSSLIDHSFRMQKEAQTHSESVKFRHFKSVNYVLRDLHSVLKGITMTYPEILGSSVFDYNDIYRRLCPFLISLKNEFTSMPCLYVVICDVFKAFDTIDQDKLLTVMREVILNDEYIVKLSSQVCCTKKSLWAQYSQILSDQNNSNVEKITASLPPHILHQVLINQEKSRMMRREQLDHCLSEHVKHNVLLLDENFYLQEVGIPQGSLLSSLLCSFYYGHLEKNVLIPFIEKTCMSAEVDLSKMCGNVCAAEGSSKDGILSSPSYMLLRFIDDFLFISTSKKQAASFFSRLQRGIREYNCKMNTDKFCMNFDVDDKSWLLSKRVYLSEDGTPFLPWSGLLINCHTLEIQADYTRYLKNHLRSTLTVCWKDKPGQHLEVKLCSYLRPKCHPIFYDSNINSAPIVRLNIYQVFLLCAMKFHCYICDLSKICKLHAEYHLEIIQRSFRYMHKLIRKRMHLIDIDSHFHPMLQLEREEVEWLGLNAYIRVLRRKQSRHKELLSFLRSKMAYCLVQSASSELKYAVDNSHSSLFWKIKY